MKKVRFFSTVVLILFLSGILLSAASALAAPKADVIFVHGRIYKPPRYDGMRSGLPNARRRQRRKSGFAGAAGITRSGASRRLDAITLGHPAIFTRVDGHLCVVNTAALEAAGITKETPDFD